MLSLGIPSMALEHEAALFYHFLNLPRMPVNPADGLSKAFGIARFEKHNLFLIEIVSDSFGIRNNYRPFHGQVFEDARGHIEFRERVAAIRNNPQINCCKSLRNLILRLGAMIVHGLLKAKLSEQLRYLIHVRCSAAIDVKLQSTDLLLELRHRMNCRVKAVAFRNKAVKHEFE